MGFTATKQTETKQRNELKIATCVACHTSINAVDHLCELIGSTSADSEVKMHQTKCIGVINHAIAPCMFKDLISDIGDAQYSLVIEESTDITSVKQLCVVIRYFSVKLNKTVSTFLRLVSLDGETAEAIAFTLTSFFTKHWAGHKEMHWIRNRRLQCYGGKEKFCVHAPAPAQPRSSGAQVCLSFNTAVCKQGS